MSESSAKGRKKRDDQLVPTQDTLLLAVGYLQRAAFLLKGLPSTLAGDRVDDNDNDNSNDDYADTTTSTTIIPRPASTTGPESIGVDVRSITGILSRAEEEIHGLLGKVLGEGTGSSSSSSSSSAVVVKREPTPSEGSAMDDDASADADADACAGAPSGGSEGGGRTIDGCSRGARELLQLMKLAAAAGGAVSSSGRSRGASSGSSAIGVGKEKKQGRGGSAGGGAGAKVKGAVAGGQAAKKRDREVLYDEGDESPSTGMGRGEDGLTEEGSKGGRSKGQQKATTPSAAKRRKGGAATDAGATPAGGEGDEDLDENAAAALAAANCKRRWELRRMRLQDVNALGGGKGGEGAACGVAEGGKSPAAAGRRGGNFPASAGDSASEGIVEKAVRPSLWASSNSRRKGNSSSTAASASEAASSVSSSSSDSAAAGAAATPSSGPGPTANVWVCAFCTLENPMRARMCLACNSHRAMGVKTTNTTAEAGAVGSGLLIGGLEEMNASAGGQGNSASTPRKPRPPTVPLVIAPLHPYREPKLGSEYQVDITELPTPRDDCYQGEESGFGTVEDDFEFGSLLWRRPETHDEGEATSKHARIDQYLSRFPRRESPEALRVLLCCSFDTTKALSLASCVRHLKLTIPQERCAELLRYQGDRFDAIGNGTDDRDGLEAEVGGEEEMSVPGEASVSAAAAGVPKETKETAPKIYNFGFLARDTPPSYHDLLPAPLLSDLLESLGLHGSEATVAFQVQVALKAVMGSSLLKFNPLLAADGDVEAPTLVPRPTNSGATSSSSSAPTASDSCPKSPARKPLLAAVEGVEVAAPSTPASTGAIRGDETVPETPVLQVAAPLNIADVSDPTRSSLEEIDAVASYTTHLTRDLIAPRVSMAAKYVDELKAPPDSPLLDAFFRFMSVHGKDWNRLTRLFKTYEDESASISTEPNDTASSSYGAPTAAIDTAIVELYRCLRVSELQHFYYCRVVSSPRYKERKSEAKRKHKRHARMQQLKIQQEQKAQNRLLQQQQRLQSTATGDVADSNLAQADVETADGGDVEGVDVPGSCCGDNADDGDASSTAEEVGSHADRVEASADVQ